MSIFGPTVTLINRTSRVLNVRFDGRDQEIKPGKNYGFPEKVVPYAKEQNVLMGSEDPENPTYSGRVHLVGVEGTQDDVSPLEQSNAPQRYNRNSAYFKRLQTGKSKEIVEKRHVSNLDAVVSQSADFVGDA
jgi:hypothetical protein